MFKFKPSFPCVSPVIDYPPSWYVSLYLALYRIGTSPCNFKKDSHELCTYNALHNVSSKDTVAIVLRLYTITVEYGGFWWCFHLVLTLSAAEYHFLFLWFFTLKKNTDMLLQGQEALNTQSKDIR